MQIHRVHVLHHSHTQIFQTNMPQTFWHTDRHLFTCSSCMSQVHAYACSCVVCLRARAWLAPVGSAYWDGTRVPLIPSYPAYISAYVCIHMCMYMVCLCTYVPAWVLHLSLRIRRIKHICICVHAYVYVVCLCTVCMCMHESSTHSNIFSVHVFVCSCVYMYTYTSIYLHIYIYTYTKTNTHTHTHLCIYTHTFCLCIYMCTFIHVHRSTDDLISTDMFVPVGVKVSQYAQASDSVVRFWCETRCANLCVSMHVCVHVCAYTWTHASRSAGMCMPCDACCIHVHTCICIQYLWTHE